MFSILCVLNKLSTNLQANLNRSEGKKPTGFEANFDSIITQGHHFKVTYENYNKTLEYYKNIAKTILIIAVFYKIKTYHKP